MRVVYRPMQRARTAIAPALPTPALIGAGCSLLLLLLTGVWTVALVVVAYGIMFYACTRRRLEDPFELDVMYLLYFGLYCVVPFVLVGLKPDRYDQRLLDPSLQFLTMLSMLGVFAGMVSPVFQFITKSDFRVDHEWDPKEAKFVAWIFLSFGVALLVYLVMTVGVQTYLNSRYVDSYVAERGKGYLVAGIYVLEVGILILALSTAEYRRKLNIWAFVIAAGVCLAYLRIGRRGISLSIGMGLMIIIHFYFKPIRWKTVGVMALTAFLCFMVIGQARAFADQGWEGMVTAVKEQTSLEDVWFTFEEPVAVQTAFKEVQQYIPQQSPYRYGMSYIEAFEALIPEKLHPQRPLTSSQWFAYFYDPQTAARGGGFSFSVFAEGYMNFGLLGVLGVGFLQGALIRRFVEFRWKNPMNKSRLLIVAAVSTQLAYFIRGEFASILKQNIVIVLIPAFLAAAFLGRPRRAQVPVRGFSATAIGAQR